MYKTILHPTDLSEDHYNLCKESVEIAKAFGAKLHFLHVIQLPSSVQIAQSLGFTELAAPATDDAQTVMTLLGESLGIPQNQLHVEVGSIKQYILDYINKLGCDLVILGNHSDKAFPSFLGSTAHAIIQHAPCNVMTLKVTKKSI